MTTPTSTPTPRPQPQPSGRRRFLATGVAAGGATVAASLLPSVAFAHAPAAYETWLTLSGVDAAANVAALNAALATGTIVYIEPGVWPLNANVVVGPHATLRGVDRRSSVLNFSAGGGLVVGNQIEGFSGITIENLTIDQGDIGLSFVTTGEWADYATIRRVIISGSTNDGIHIPNGSPTGTTSWTNPPSLGVQEPALLQNLYFQDVAISDCGGHGFRVDAPLIQSLFLQGVVVDGFGSNPGGEGPGFDEHYGFWMNGRAHMTQIRIGVVSNSDFGCRFDDGSRYTTLANWSIDMDVPGREFTFADPAPPVALGNGMASVGVP